MSTISRAASSSPPASPPPPASPALASAARIARSYGLIPPDQRRNLRPRRNPHLRRPASAHHALAGPRVPPQHDLQSALRQRDSPRQAMPSSAFRPPDFADWRLTVDGMVAQPTSFSLADLKSLPVRSQITEVACEEGWSYIAEWIGTPLSHVLDAVGVLPQARYVVYFSIEPDWWESIDMADALHPQTFLTYGHERRRSSRRLRRPAAPARPPPTRLQERQVHHPHHRHRRSERASAKAWAPHAPEGGYAWYAGI